MHGSFFLRLFSLFFGPYSTMPVTKGDPRKILAHPQRLYKLPSPLLSPAIDNDYTYKFPVN